MRSDDDSSVQITGGTSSAPCQCKMEGLRQGCADRRVAPTATTDYIRKFLPRYTWRTASLSTISLG
jgi:hypothetical protein